MFRRTKKFLVILLTIILVLTNIGTACFAEEPQLLTAPGRTIKSIHAGGDYSVILYDDGTVSTFGENDDGELGLGKDENVNIPTDIEGLTDVKALDVGQSHVFAIKEDGSVWTWGKNNNGQLGNKEAKLGLSENAPIPVQLQLNDFKAISAGNDHSAMLKSDGTVWCWGGNFSGQLGNGEFGDIFKPELEPIQSLDLTDVKDVFAGSLCTFALKNDGTLFSWGFNGLHGQLGNGSTENVNRPVQVLTDVKKLASGKSAHAFAFKNDGTIWAWGRNSFGQLGDGTTDNNSIIPIQITGLEGVIEITPGQLHTVALKEDGTVCAWGRNNVGQLGNGTYIDSIDPVQVEGLTNIVSIATGGSHTIAIGSDGTVWTWGDNTSGQLGDGTNENRNSPVMIIEPEQEPEPVVADKTALQSKVDEVKDYKAEDYTEESWAVFKEALDAAQGVLADEEATQEAVDNALEALNEAIEGLEEVVEPILPLTVVVKGKDGTEIRTIEYDMSEWEYVKRQHYSARDSMPSNRLASAEGVFLTDLLNDAEIDIDSIIGFKFISDDGYGSSISKSELLDVKRYYYPNIHEENQEEGAVEVGPMLALRSYVAGRGSTELPSWDIIDDLNTIRLFVGQKNPDDVNYGMFAKWLCEIEIEVEVKEAEVEVTYETVQDVTNIDPDSVTFVPNERKFIVPVDVTEFTFQDGEKKIKAIYVDEKWTFEAEYIPLDVIIKNADGSKIVEYIDYNIAAFENIVRQNYSVKDSHPNSRLASRLAAGEGVYLRDFLNAFDIDVDSVVNINFYPNDPWPTPMSKTTLFDEERYYYPNIFEEDQEEGEELVEPMLALKAFVGARDSYELPSWDKIDYLNSIRLFYGQTNPAEKTYMNCAKWIRKIEVEMETEDIVEVDKTALQSKADEAANLKEEDYTKESWEAFAEAFADAQSVLDDDEATQEAVDNALEALNEAIEGLEEVVEPILPLTVVVKGKDGTEIRTIEYDMSEWEYVKRQHYSARDSMPSNRLASAEGVFLTDLLNDAEIDIDSIIGFKFISDDGYGSSISKSELLDVKRYYYPNIHEENQEEGAVEVGPMLALRSYVAGRGSTELPSWDIIDDLNTIRLFVGQKNPDDINYGMFAKWLCKIEIEVEEVEEPAPKYELNVKDSDDYEIEETESGVMLTLKQDATGFKHFGATVKAIEGKLGQLEVVFTHLRNNVQQSLNSIKADFDAEEMSTEAGFNIEPGDVIKIYMVDELTNETDRNPIILR